MLDIPKEGAQLGRSKVSAKKIRLIIDTYKFSRRPVIDIAKDHKMSIHVVYRILEWDPENRMTIKNRIVQRIGEANFRKLKEAIQDSLNNGGWGLKPVYLQFGVTAFEVSRIRRLWGLGDPTNRKSKETIKEIVDLYMDESVDLNDIKKKYDVSRKQIENYLFARNIFFRRDPIGIRDQVNNIKTSISPEEIEQLVSDYQNKPETIVDISRRYGCAGNLVRKILAEHNVPLKQVPFSRKRKGWWDDMTQPTQEGEGETEQ